MVVANPEEEGVVVTPQDKLDQIAGPCAKQTAVDDKIMRDVKKGGRVADAFKL